MEKKLAAVLMLPNKGAYSPIKFGCIQADFIKTMMPDGSCDKWIANGKIYYDIEEFNKMCIKVTPAAYAQRLIAIPFLFEVEVKREEPEAPKPLPLSSPPTKKKKKQKAKS
jgi:hypothetical protein